MRKENLQAVWEKVQTTLRQLPGNDQKVSFLAAEFNMSHAAAQMWLDDFDMKATFEMAMRMGAYAVQDAMKNAVYEGPGNDTMVPVVKEFHCFDTPILYLVAQKFLHSLEEKGIEKFAFSINTTAAAKVFFVMQRYGWKVNGVEEVPLFLSGEGVPHMTPAFIVAHQS